ncbi:hypothetical protein GCM10020367_57290 [Streptomyces sannanensis]|uniref:Peptidase S8/S53 domain-containing protein n=1 Tax=Streptomyces sannanensis TaxID=285536 RepID=A0ABP6SJQ8_9ACTN
MHGWGRETTTTGGFWDRPGDLQGGAEEIARYTDSFSGTSSASPVVVGAPASLQGMLKASGLTLMTPERAREVLQATGSPQQDAPGRPASQRIGNRPDIKAAVARLTPSTVGQGRAERHWDELVPYPPGTPAAPQALRGGCLVQPEPPRPRDPPHRHPVLGRRAAPPGASRRSCTCSSTTPGVS